MKQYEIDCYKVTESYDRDYQVIAYVSNATLAQQLVNKSRNYRSYYPHKQIITIFDTMEEIEANSATNLIKSAKSKLTAAEIAALGL